MSLENPIVVSLSRACVGYYIHFCPLFNTLDLRTRVPRWGIYWSAIIFSAVIFAAISKTIDVLEDSTNCTKYLCACAALALTWSALGPRLLMAQQLPNLGSGAGDARPCNQLSGQRPGEGQAYSADARSLSR